MAVLSDDPVRTRLPSTLNATARTELVCPLNVWSGLAVSASDRMAVLSQDPVRTRLPSTLKATEETLGRKLIFPSVCPLCPLKVWRELPLLASHKIAVPLEDPVRTRLPSLLNATELTKPVVCPLKVCRGLAVS